MNRAQARSSSSAYAWMVALLLLVVWMLCYLDRQLIFFVLPLVQVDFQLSSLQLGLLGTAFLWSYALCSPFTGYLADRIGSKSLICGSLLAWSLLTLFTAFANSYFELLSSRILMGISEALFLPAALSLLAAYHSNRTRSRAMGLLYSGNYPGLVLGGVLGGALGAKFGWRFDFLLFGMIGCCYAVSLVWTLRDKRASPVSGEIPRTPAFTFAQATREVLRSAGYARNLVVFALASVCDWAIYTWMPLYLYEEFHLSLASAGFAAIFYMKTGNCVGLFAGGVLSDWWASSAPSARARVQACSLLVASPFLLTAGHTHVDRVLYGAMFLYGIGKGAYDGSTVPLVCEQVPEALRATAIGIMNAIGAFSGGVIAAVCGAAKAGIGFNGVLAACAALLAAAGVISLQGQSHGQIRWACSAEAPSER